MKNRAFFLTVYILALAVTLVNVFFIIKNYLYADINDLPEGTLVSETVSPSGKKTVKVFLVKNSIGTGIRGELFEEGKKPRNIFWQTGIDSINVTWNDESIIYFDNVPIPGSGDAPYDCRRGTSLFTDGALESERFAEGGKNE